MASKMTWHSMATTRFIRKGIQQAEFVFSVVAASHIGIPSLAVVKSKISQKRRKVKRRRVLMEEITTDGRYSICREGGRDSLERQSHHHRRTSTKGATDSRFPLVVHAHLLISTDCPCRRVPFHTAHNIGKMVNGTLSLSLFPPCPPK